MTKALTVHNAEIKTATVEIQTLTISGKQVTLAVFRQLREAPLIDRDGTFNGQPWGVVNYHPDRCAAEEAHWHVVWQKGNELLRSFVPEANPDWLYDADGVPKDGPRFLELRSRHDEARDAIEALPQLFIAV